MWINVMPFSLPWCVFCLGPLALMALLIPASKCCWRLCSFSCRKHGAVHGMLTETARTTAVGIMHLRHATNGRFLFATCYFAACTRASEELHVKPAGFFFIFFLTQRIIRCTVWDEIRRHSKCNHSYNSMKTLFILALVWVIHVSVL